MKANSVIKKLKLCSSFAWLVFILIASSGIFAISKGASDGYIVIFVMVSALIIYLFYTDLEKDIECLVKRYNKESFSKDEDTQGESNER